MGGGETSHSEEFCVNSAQSASFSHDPLLRTFWVAWHGADRLARAVYTVVAIVCEYRAVAKMDDAHQRAANRLLRLCHVNQERARANGASTACAHLAPRLQGIYIKLAQYLAQLDHLLPAQVRWRPVQPQLLRQAGMHRP